MRRLLTDDIRITLNFPLLDVIQIARMYNNIVIFQYKIIKAPFWSQTKYAKCAYYTHVLHPRLGLAHLSHTGYR